jgi:hypothetical protein
MTQLDLGVLICHYAPVALSQCSRKAQLVQINLTPVNYSVTQWKFYAKPANSLQKFISNALSLYVQLRNLIVAASTYRTKINPSSHKRGVNNGVVASLLSDDNY